MTDKEALEKIAELCKPGQQLYHIQCIDIMCDVWNITRRQINQQSDKEAK